MVWRLLAVLAAFLLPASVAWAACGLHPVADFKVTLEDSSPLVDARINGQPVKMVADSGAFYSSLSQGTVAQFKLSRTAGNPFMYTIGIGGTQSITITTVNAFTIADQTLSKEVFLVDDNEFGVAGLMGENILGLVDAYYDLPDGVIKLLHPTGCGSRPFVVWDATKPFSMIPLLPHEGQFKEITAEAFVNGKKIKVQFDTGASRSMLSLDAAKHAGLDPNGAGSRPGGVHRGIGRRFVESWIVPVESFKIGDEEVRHTELRIAPVDLVDVDMLLGADFFLSHRVYVANSQQRIYFTYSGGPVFNLDAPPQSSNARAASSEPKPDAAGVKPSDGSIPPTDADGFTRRGAALASRRQFEPALADLAQAIALAPTEPRFLIERARVYWESGKPDLATTDVDQALKLKSDESDALVMRAELRLAGEDKPGGLADLDAADRALPKEADGRLDMARLYDQADAAAKEIGQLNLWILAHPADNRLAMALNERCWTRALWNIEPDKAVADCDAALRRLRRTADILDSRGLAHLRLGQNDLAIADYNAALAADPKIAWSLYGRGVAKLREGRAAEGKADISAATALEAKLPELARAHGLDH